MTEQEKVALIETEQRSKANSHRIDALEGRVKDIEEDQKAIYKIASSVEIIAQRVNHIEEKVDDTNQKVAAQTLAMAETKREMAERVMEAENKPYKQTAGNVNSIKVAAITAIATLLATGLFGAIVSFLTK